MYLHVTTIATPHKLQPWERYQDDMGGGIGGKKRGELGSLKISGMSNWWGRERTGDRYCQGVNSTGSLTFALEKGHSRIEKKPNTIRLH